MSGRWYAPALYFDRTYTWVTYYGNMWVIDAVQAEDSTTAVRILTEYGVDYVVIQAPPGRYVDQMPHGGLRSVVLDDHAHFKRVFANSRTRLYEFVSDEEIAARAQVRSGDP